MSNIALMEDFCLLHCSMEQGCLHDEFPLETTMLVRGVLLMDEFVHSL